MSAVRIDRHRKQPSSLSFPNSSRVLGTITANWLLVPCPVTAALAWQPSTNGYARRSLQPKPQRQARPPGCSHQEGISGSSVPAESPSAGSADLLPFWRKCKRARRVKRTTGAPAPSGSPCAARASVVSGDASHLAQHWRGIRVVLVWQMALDAQLAWQV